MTRSSRRWILLWLIAALVAEARAGNGATDSLQEAVASARAQAASPTQRADPSPAQDPAPTPVATPAEDAQQEPPTRTESHAVEDVLTQYRDALGSLDVRRLRPVWPTVDERALAKAFARLEQQSLTFDACLIQIVGTRADASCKGNIRIVSRVGNRLARYQPGQWKFMLSTSGSGWVIQSVEAR